MGRKILAVIAALITAWATFLIADMISTRVWPMPGAFEYMNREAISAYFASRPTTAYGMVLFGYIVGSFLGGFIVTKMSRRESPGLSLPIILGIILTVGGLSNFLLLPGRPIWFITAALLIFIPVTLLGHRFAR